MKVPAIKTKFTNESFFEFCLDHIQDFEMGNIDFNNLDVSEVTDLTECFQCMELDEYTWKGIENLKFGKLENLTHTFSESNFNGDISKWDLSEVKTIKGCFSYCKEFQFKNSENYNFSKKLDVSDSAFKGCENILNESHDKIVDILRFSRECESILADCNIEIDEDEVLRLFDSYEMYYDICKVNPLF